MRGRNRWRQGVGVVLLIGCMGGASAQSLLEQGSSLLKGLTGGSGGGAQSVLANDELIAGLKEALKVGTGNVTELTDAFPLDAVG